MYIYKHLQQQENIAFFYVYCLLMLLIDYHALIFKLEILGFFLALLLHFYLEFNEVNEVIKITHQLGFLKLLTLRLVLIFFEGKQTVFSQEHLTSKRHFKCVWSWLG